MYLTEVERSVPSVEHALHVERVEQESVLLPAQRRQRRVGSEVAVEQRWTTVRQVQLARRIHDLRFVYTHNILFSFLKLIIVSVVFVCSEYSLFIISPSQ